MLDSGSSGTRVSRFAEAVNAQLPTTPMSCWETDRAFLEQLHRPFNFDRLKAVAERVTKMLHLAGNSPLQESTIPAVELTTVVTLVPELTSVDLGALAVLPVTNPSESV